MLLVLQRVAPETCVFLLCPSVLSIKVRFSRASHIKKLSDLNRLFRALSAEDAVYKWETLFPYVLQSVPRRSVGVFKGLFIDCGATEPSVINGLRYLPDASFVSTGTPKILSNQSLFPTLSTLRSFPLDRHSKFCYVVPVYRSGKYLVRTTYFYGAVNGLDTLPPVFDLIVDGTFWAVVNTTEDYVRGLSRYYEAVFLAKGRTMSICVAKNKLTDSDMFISTLELVLLEDSVYNSTNFEKYGLGVVARNSFGNQGPSLRFPDDPFDRYWEPFHASNLTPTTNRGNISSSGFWNLPPSKVFGAALTTDLPKPLELHWPPMSLLNSSYYIALYFANHPDSLSDDSRVLNVYINGIPYYKNVNVTQSGVVVFATQWPLSGPTKLVLTPADGSHMAPLINAGEVLNILVLGGRTVTRDVIALEKLKKSLQNLPLDWNGDPCHPQGYSWTGVICSDGPNSRVVALNLSNMRVSGLLSPSIANLTALTDIILGRNNLTGPIPDLSKLGRLERLHLQDNGFTGEIPSSIAVIDTLHELFVQNNNLTGQVPRSLLTKPGLFLQTSPGNNFTRLSNTLS
ncbi:putative leucine-rich repeat receptor-like serine/threonine-protein kinase At2g14440 [Aristolochia californica]|uniref:putative leucine-rich repeat receptor-like serine/threonine-protein kinase At2g14440 n=1 Tax=Aristolochia californica TaxID=171875 RepID=UPI0035D54175